MSDKHHQRITPCFLGRTDALEDACPLAVLRESFEPKTPFDRLEKASILQRRFLKRARYLPPRSRFDITKRCSGCLFWYSQTQEMMANQGMSIDLVATMVGHANSEITRDVYKHVFESDLERAVQAMPPLFKKGGVQK